MQFTLGHLAAAIVCVFVIAAFGPLGTWVRRRNWRELARRAWRGGRDE